MKNRQPVDLAATLARLIARGAVIIVGRDERDRPIYDVPRDHRGIAIPDREA